MFRNKETHPRACVVLLLHSISVKAILENLSDATYDKVSEKSVHVSSHILALIASWLWNCLNVNKLIAWNMVLADKGAAHSFTANCMFLIWNPQLFTSRNPHWHARDRFCQIYEDKQQTSLMLTLTSSSRK